MPFILEGFERGDRAFHIVSREHRAAHLERLAQEGIDTAAAESRGELEVLTWQDTYIKDGRFDQHLMIETLLKIIAPGNAKPGKVSRNIANPVICASDLSKFDASVLIDIMRTHPMVIIGGILQENPFFIPSGQMLQEIEARKASKQASPGKPE